MDARGDVVLGQKTEDARIQCTPEAAVDEHQGGSGCDGTVGGKPVDHAARCVGVGDTLEPRMGVAKLCAPFRIVRIDAVAFRMARTQAIVALHVITQLDDLAAVKLQGKLPAPDRHRVSHWRFGTG
jgi:hypothetical protein